MVEDELIPKLLLSLELDPQDIMPVSEGDTMTGRKLSANIRDGEIEGVRVFAAIPTFSFSDEKKGEHFTTVTMNEKDLRTGTSGKLKFEVQSIDRNGYAHVKARVSPTRL